MKITVTVNRSGWSQHEIEVPSDFDFNDENLVWELHEYCTVGNEIDGETTRLDVDIEKGDRS